MIDGGSLLPGWERGPPARPAPASRTSYGSPQRQQHGHGAKAAQEENTPKRMASASGSLPGPAASPSHLAQGSHGTACATSSPVPAAPAQPAAPWLAREAGSRGSTGRQPSPRGSHVCAAGQAAQPQPGDGRAGAAMLASPQPAAPPEAPTEGRHVGAQRHGWGAGRCSGASGQGLAAAARRAACGARGRGSPAGSGNRPGRLPGLWQGGRGGGETQSSPAGPGLCSPARPRLLILALGRHHGSISSARRRCAVGLGAAGRCWQVVATGAAAQPSPGQAPRRAPSQLLAEPLLSRQPGADAALPLPARLRPWLGQTHMWP